MNQQNRMARSNRNERAGWPIEKLFAYVKARSEALDATDPKVLVQRIEKCSCSLAAAIRRGTTIESSRGMDLLDRYEALRLALHKTPAGEAAWQGWCKERGFSTSHDAYDCFA